MDKFATKGRMKNGGKYEDGGRKGPLKKVKAAIRKANNKAGAVKNRLEKKVTDAIKRKKAEKAESFRDGGRKSRAENYKMSNKSTKRRSKTIETLDRRDMLPGYSNNERTLRPSTDTRKVAMKTKMSGKGDSNTYKRMRTKEVDAGEGTITKKKIGFSDRKNKKRGATSYDRETTKAIGKKRAARIVKRYGKQQDKMEKRKANLDKKRDRYS